MSQLLGLIILPGCHVMLGLAVCSLSLRMCEQTCHLERFALILAPPFPYPAIPEPAHLLVLPSAPSQAAEAPRDRGSCKGPGIASMQNICCHPHSLASSRSGFLVPFVPPLTGPFLLSFPDFGVSAPSTSSNLGFLFGNLEFGCQKVYSQ